MPQKCFMIKASWMPPMKSTGPRGRIKSHPLQLNVTSKVCGIVGQSHLEGTTLTSKSRRVTRWFETPTCQAFQTTAASELNRRRFLFRIWDLKFDLMVLEETDVSGGLSFSFEWGLGRERWCMLTLSFLTTFRNSSLTIKTPWKPGGLVSLRHVCRTLFDWMCPNDKTAFAGHDERVGGPELCCWPRQMMGMDLAFTVPFDRCPVTNSSYSCLKTSKHWRLSDISVPEEQASCSDPKNAWIVCLESWIDTPAPARDKLHHPVLLSAETCCQLLESQR